MNESAHLPPVSVVIPAYNRADRIAEAVRSALDQTLPPHEVVVVDDGSRDGTAAAAAAIHDPRLRVIEQPNAGAGVARNRGIAATTAPWIAFLDSDDTWAPDKLAVQLPETLRRGHDLCFTDLTFVPEPPREGEPIPRWNHHIARELSRTPTASGPIDDPFTLLTRGGDLLFTSTLLMRRDALPTPAYRTQARVSEDFDLYLRLAEHRLRFGYLDRPLARRGWGSNWDVAKAYRYRIRAMGEVAHRLRGVRADDTATLHAAIRREHRCLAGHHRQRGRLLAAAARYVRAIAAA